MPILLCAGVSVVIAWLRGASLARLGAVRVRWLILPLLALGMQVLTFRRTEATPTGTALWVQLGAGAFLLLFIAANVHYRALLLVAAGTLMNLTVITANGGYMPVRPTDLARIGYLESAVRLESGGVYQKSIALTDRTSLPWLADVIHLPLPFSAGRMISPGDIAIGVGTFFVIQRLLVPKNAISRPSAAER
jgi:Family of unknown function (DUF5317)